MWKQKLSSRKFWVAIIGFVTAILVTFKIDNLTIEQVTSVIGALGVLVSYIIGEGMIDSKRFYMTEENNDTNVIGFRVESDGTDDDY